MAGKGRDLSPAVRTPIVQESLDRSSLRGPAPIIGLYRKSRPFRGTHRGHSPAVPMTQPQTQTHASHSPKAQPDATDFVHDVFDRKHDEHLDAETLENALATLLAMYPDAAVGAHTTAGMVVPMPDSVPLKRNPALHGARSTARLPQRLASAHGRPERGRARAERDRENGRYRDLSGCARSRMQARALFRRAEVKVPAARRD